MNSLLFEEQQSFRQPWLWIMMLGILILLLVVLGLILFQAPDRGDTLQAAVGVSVGILVVIGTAVLMYTLKLSVRLDAEGLHVRFSPLVRRDIPLDQIVRWEARTYRPILEYGGWGIRCGWKGMAYNVSGNQGVQLELANGKRILIGSQRAEELARAIGEAKGNAAR
jgi:hypothetical protein